MAPLFSTNHFYAESGFSQEGLDDHLAVGDNRDRTRRVSEDGRMLQMTIKGSDAQGDPYETVEVFDRQ